MNYCLKDYVGIRGCGSAPESGVYVNQLAGVSLKNTQMIANSEQVTYAGVFTDVQDRSWRRLCLDLTANLKKDHEIRMHRGLFHLSTHDEGVLVPPAEAYRGMIVETGIDNNGFFAQLVKSVTVDLPEAMDSPLSVKIFDRAGVVLDTLTIESPVEGANTVPVNKLYAASMLFIATDATGQQQKATKVYDTVTDGYLKLLYNLVDYCSPYVTGGTSTIDRPDHTAIDTYTYGISAIIQPMCDYSAVVCWNPHLFIDPWLYLLGAELMQERINSDRINDLTGVDIEKAKALYDTYIMQYVAALDVTVSGLSLKEDSCLICREKIKREYVLP